jgi:hypothetical protein
MNRVKGNPACWRPIENPGGREVGKLALLSAAPAPASGLNAVRLLGHSADEGQDCAKCGLGYERMLRELRACAVWEQSPADSELREEHRVAVYNTELTRSLLYFVSEHAAERWLSQYTRAYFEPTPRLFQRYVQDGVEKMGCIPTGKDVHFDGELLEGRMCPEIDPRGCLGHELRDGYKTQPQFRFVSRCNRDDGWESPVRVAGLDGKSSRVGSLPLCEWVSNVDAEEPDHLSVFSESWHIPFEDEGLPGIACALGAPWAFEQTVRDAAHRQAHITRGRRPDINHLWRMVFELEAARVAVLGDQLSIDDLKQFWTSADVHRYVAQMCVGLDSGFARAIQRRIGSYVHEQLPSRRTGTDANESSVKVLNFVGAIPAKGNGLARDIGTGCPGPEAWDTIEIVLVSDRRVQVNRNGSPGESYNYSEFGLADGRTDAPNRAWLTLCQFAEGRGVLQCASVMGSPRSKLEKQIEALRKTLKGHFHLEGDPIRFVRGTGYQAQFKIRSSAASEY